MSSDGIDPEPDDAAPVETPEGHFRPTGPPSKRALTLVVVPLIILVIGSNVANYFGAGLISERPLLVMILSSQIKWAVLAVNQLDTAVFFAVGMLRNLAPDPLFYVLGYWYSDAAVVWMEQRTAKMGELLRSVEQAFPKWGRPLVLLFPNNPICLLAGAARMPVIEFAVLNVIGTAGRLILIKIFGEAFENPINWVLDFFRDYRIPLLIIGGLAFAFTVWNETRKGTSEVQALANLEHEFDPEHPERFDVTPGRDDGPGEAGSSAGEPVGDTDDR